MILLVTNKRDITTDYIVREIERRRLAYVRLNTEAVASARVTLRPNNPQYDTLLCEGDSIRLSAVRAAYFRRPETPIIADNVGNFEVRSYCASEWSALLKTLIGRMENLWFNDPHAIAKAEDKPRQLLAALALKFDVPDTIVSNDPDCVRAFVGNDPTIAKPLRHALLEDGDTGRVIFTNRISSDSVQNDASVSAAPVIFQREIEKDCDLRVTVVGSRVFSTAIHSQIKEETSVDWRRGMRPDLKHEIVDIPAAIARSCVSLTRNLGLRFGAIDLIRDRNGKYWFLEINPNGQWAWIENRTGAPIAAAIVDELESICNS